VKVARPISVRSLMHHKLCKLAAVVINIGFILCSGASPLEADNCLTLEDCIRMALENRSELAAAEHQHESERLKLAAQEKGFGYRTDLALSLKRHDQDNQVENSLPTGEVTKYQNKETLNLKQIFPWGTTVNLYIDNSLTDSNNDVFAQLEDNALTYGVSVQHDLLIPSLQYLDIIEAKARLKASEASLELTRRQVIFEVSKVYYNLLRAYQTLEVRSKALQIAQSLSELATKQFERGVAIDVSLLEARVSQSLAEANMQQACLNIETSRNNLLRALEQEYGTVNLCPFYARQEVHIPQKKRLEAIVRNNPKLDVLRSQIEQLEAERKREKRNFQKSLVLEANIERDSYGRNFEKVYYRDQYDQNWSIGMTFNIPMWDNGVNKNNVEAIEYQMKNLSATINASYQTLAADLGNTLDTLKRLDTVISVLSQARRYAERNLELVNAKFARGLNNVDDVVRVEQNLTNTRLSMLNTIIDYNINVARLFFLTGYEQLFPTKEEKDRHSTQ